MPPIMEELIHLSKILNVLYYLFLHKLVLFYILCGKIKKDYFMLQLKNKDIRRRVNQLIWQNVQ